MTIQREFSAGAVIFHIDESGEPQFLLLHYHFKGDYWDFPRGNLEGKESSMDAATREIQEETGLAGKDIVFIPGLKESAQWFYVWKKVKRFKSVTYFLAESKKKEVKLSEEHLGYKWMPFDDAVVRLTYDNAKSILKKANEFLQKRPTVKKFLSDK